MLTLTVMYVALLAGISSADVTKARVYLFAATLEWPLGNHESVGVVDFTQTAQNSVFINGSVYNLTPGLHGFHIHEFGDLSNNCLGAGAHFNPFNTTHGAPTDAIHHVGDLGNIETPANTEVTPINMQAVLTLNGALSILGRGLVVHVGADDLGRGNFNDSLTTGHAGARYACGVIATVEETPVTIHNNSSSPAARYGTILGLLLVLFRIVFIQ